MRGGLYGPGLAWRRSAGDFGEILAVGMPCGEAARSEGLYHDPDRRQSGCNRSRRAPRVARVYNVCKHRAHPVLVGEGSVRRIVCPYHAWSHRLDGQLANAPHTADLKDFSTAEIRLTEVRVEEFCGFVFASLDPAAAALRTLSGSLESEIRRWWLWPDTCLMRHSRRSSMIVLHIIPLGVDRTLET